MVKPNSKGHTMMRRKTRRKRRKRRTRRSWCYDNGETDTGGTPEYWQTPQTEPKCRKRPERAHLPVQ
jgi:hypothetical protein